MGQGLPRTQTNWLFDVGVVGLIIGLMTVGYQFDCTVDSIIGMSRVRKLTDWTGSLTVF